MTYKLQLTEKPDHAVVVTSVEEQPLAVIRDEVRLHGYQVGPVEHEADNYRFEARSDEPGKVREFLMGLDDVELNA
ncbi:MAG TPA: hypothetical protein VFI31_01795 [Pirellulales bacterium]|nr:hypothetical protein [Pirellulales bacterium]